MITKGPWKWHKRQHSSTHFLANVDETDDDFCIVDDGSAYGEYGVRIDVNGDDARLIAASPDLLAALTGLLEIYDDHSGKVWTTASKRRALDAAHEAVKLALGEKE